MATRRIVPRNDDEGSIGKPTKQWGDVQTKKINGKTPAEFIASETPKEHSLDTHIAVTLAELSAIVSDKDVASTDVATTSAAGLMSASDKTKLDGMPPIAEGDAGKIVVVKGDESGYENVDLPVLPVASAETLGGVKVGSGLEIVDGILSVVRGGGYMGDGTLWYTSSDEYLVPTGNYTYILVGGGHADGRGGQIVEGTITITDLVTLVIGGQSSSSSFEHDGVTVTATSGDNGAAVNELPKILRVGMQEAYLGGGRNARFDPVKIAASVAAKSVPSANISINASGTLTLTSAPVESGAQVDGVTQFSGTMPARSGSRAAYNIPSAAITTTAISGLGYGGGSSGVANDSAKAGVLILIAEGVHYSLD